MSRNSRVDKEIDSVAKALGIEISREILSAGNEYDYSIRATQLSFPGAFSFQIGDDYLCWTLSLLIDPQGQLALNEMSKKFIDRGELFKSYVQVASERNKRFLLLVNNRDIDQLEPEETWKSIKLEISQSYPTEEQVFTSLNLVLLDAFCIVLSLLVEEEVWGDSQVANEVSSSSS